MPWHTQKRESLRFVLKQNRVLLNTFERAVPIYADVFVCIYLFIYTFIIYKYFKINCVKKFKMLLKN